MKFQWIYLSLVVLLLSCNNKTEQFSFHDSEVEASYNAYKSDKSTATARDFISKSLQYIALHPGEKANRSLMEEGLKVSQENNIVPGVITNLIYLIREYPNDDKTGDRVLQLANIMKDNGKQGAADVLYHSFGSTYKDHPKSQEAKSMMSQEITDIDAFLLSVGEKIFEDPDEFGVNKQNAQAYVDACEAYALANPNSVASPDFLYRASEIARTLRTFPKVLSIYDWIMDKYPDFEKAPTILFLKGFLLENEFNDINRAKEVYSLFLSKFPNHQLSDDVSFLLENLGKSDEEIMKIIEERSQQNQVQ